MVRCATASTTDCDPCLRKAKLDPKPASPAASSTDATVSPPESERDGAEAARDGELTAEGDESARLKEPWLPSSAMSCDLMQLLRSCETRLHVSPRVLHAYHMRTTSLPLGAVTYGQAANRSAHERHTAAKRTPASQGRGTRTIPAGVPARQRANGGSWCFAT